MIIGKNQYSEYLSNFLGLNSNDKLALENFHLNIIEEDESYIVNNTAIASVIFIDICNFSNKVSTYKAVDIISYLKQFYRQVFPIIE